MLILFPALLTNCGHTRCLSHVGTEGDPQSWNLYGYARNNPLRFTDADGRKCGSNGIDDETQDACFITTVHDSFLGRFFSAIGSFFSGPGLSAEERERVFGPPLLTEHARNLIFGPPGILQGVIPVGPPGEGIVPGLTSASEDLVITQDRLTYIENRHSPAGARTAGKSVFAPEVDIAKDAKSTPPQPGDFGRQVRVVDAGKTIGKDQNGNPTSKYTVVTEGNKIFNAYPGEPK